jgi:hypothetical protein
MSCSWSKRSIGGMSRYHPLLPRWKFAVTVKRTHPDEVTDYASCPGYLLFRKPYNLRVLILVPVLHSHAVDLASDGMGFTLLIPSRNRAIED